MAQHGQIKHMLSIKLISKLNVLTPANVIDRQEYVNVSMDLQVVPANEVSLNYPNIFGYNLIFIFDVAACPNDCSGHGICSTIGDVSVYSGPDYNSRLQQSGDGLGIPYVNWDKNSIQMCECDSGYFGSDCSLGKSQQQYVHLIFFLAFYSKILFFSDVPQGR